MPTNIWRHSGTTFWRHARNTQINVHPIALGRDLLPWSKQEPVSNVSFVHRCKVHGRKCHATKRVLGHPVCRETEVVQQKNSSARVQASLTTGNRRAARNVCASSREPCLPKHNQQTNKKHMTQCWPLSSNEPRTKSANEYLRTQTRPNTNAPTAQNAVLHFHREDTNTHENKNKKNTKRPIENINKTTNKLHVVATKRLHITCLQMKPCTTTRNRRKEHLQPELICCPQQDSDSSFPVLRIESCHQYNANLDVQLATTSAAEQKKISSYRFDKRNRTACAQLQRKKEKKKHQHPTIRRESLS